jgi:hypothetical protein
VNGRTLTEALAGVRESYQRALSTVTIGNQTIVRPRQDGAFVALPPGERDRSVAVRHPSVALVGFEYVFRVNETRARGRDRWQVVVQRYYYALLTRERREIIAFHWHPGVPGRPEPHLHLGVASEASTLLRAAHIPASIITLHEVLRFAIRELGVEPLRPGWEALLAI